MGIRLHVAEVYQVKYSVYDDFNNELEAVNRFLADHCEDMSWNGDSVEFADHLEIPREQLAALIGWIVSNRAEYNAWAADNTINKTAEQFIYMIAGWIERSDQRNEFVVLEWF